MPYIFDPELYQIFYLAAGKVGSLLETVIDTSQLCIKSKDVSILNVA